MTRISNGISQVSDTSRMFLVVVEMFMQIFHLNSSFDSKMMMMIESLDGVTRETACNQFHLVLHAHCVKCLHCSIGFAVSMAIDRLVDSLGFAVNLKQRTNILFHS